MQPNTCPHTQKTINISGSMRFVNGNVDDDIIETAVCADCGETLPDPAHSDISIDVDW